MNRIIKFRAWDQVENKWFEPIYEAYKGRLLDMHITLSGQPCIRSIEYCSDMRHTERYLLEQFTGLTDRNGTEIYEGDIVFIPEVKRKYVVFYQNGCFKLYHADPSLNTLVWGTIERVEELVWDIEVIGNVHSTPDLICT